MNELRRHRRQFFTDKRSPKRILYLLLAVDVAFIILHVLVPYDSALGRCFSLAQDLGCSEIYQYLKELCVVSLLGLLAVQSRSPLYLSWSLLFLYLLLDDSLQIHETLGHVVSEGLAFSPTFNLRAQDLGELVVSAFFGLLLFSIIGTAYRFSQDRVSKNASRYLLVMVVLLALPAVIGDMVHQMVESSWLLGRVSTVVDDGGEMVVMSVIVWFALLLVEQNSLRSPRE